MSFKSAGLLVVGTASTAARSVLVAIRWPARKRDKMPQPDKQESGGEQFEVAVPRGAPRGGDRPDVAGQTPQNAEMRRRRIVIAVFVAAIVVLALWLGSGSVMNDEGSYEWCAQQDLDRAGCDVINELADELGGSPSDVLHTLDNNLAPID